ncbi:MAG: FtsW/RodA/SpoVE family cell cycle protein [Candidatus Shapirobacteria bacterium]|nr:FtsW/RodA/SpoVE family cell cycle protein [Candidatus Shapirobacteria bacterium]MDD5481664.1 FtsW/RodA/SpoVE family cell cycle protein [Candidatus Shapirobacteria bacterium]
MNKKRRRFDWIILAIVVFLTVLGLLSLSAIDQKTFFDQLINILVGWAFFFLLAFFPYQILKKASWPVAVFSLILLALPLFLGAIVRGASRWINIGPFSLQPSELAKPLIIIFLSGQSNVLIGLGGIIPFFVLVFLQPDLGSSLVLLSAWAGINFYQKKNRRYFLAAVGFGLLLLPVVWATLAPFQKTRITAFLNLENDPLGSNYQSRQAIITVGSGQIIGRGLGLGSQSRLAFLPERHNDLVFASFVEAFGFLGGLSAIIAYLVLFWHLLNLSEKISDPFGQKFVIGVTTMLFFQTLVNIGMNIGLVPITGLNLPLFSYGGSSYLSTMVCLGIVQAIFSQQRFTKTEELRIH